MLRKQGDNTDLFQLVNYGYAGTFSGPSSATAARGPGYVSSYASVSRDFTLRWAADLLTLR